MSFILRIIKTGTLINDLQKDKNSFSKQYERERLIKEIKHTKDAIDCAYSKFQNVIEPDLVDSTIYELNAAQSRYTYLLNKFKEIEEVLI